MNPDSHNIPTQKKVRRLPSIKDNFGLTESEFNRCITKLIDGDDSFITNNMLHQLSESMAFLQSKYTITRNQAYDICMNTLLEFRRKLINGKISYGNLRFLFTRMCSNQFIDGEKINKKTNEAINTFLEIKSAPEDQELLYERLEAILHQLSPEQSSFIKEIYYSGKSPEKIASEQNITYANLRKRKQRILSKIRGLYFKKGNI